MQLDFSYPEGTYVVAVSGGVDSVSLLHALVAGYQNGNRYIVAHVNHGIRPDAADDAELVAAMAKDYSLSFELVELRLGPNTSEAEAREARYAFLQSVAAKHSARGIITAHHQNDVIETIFINLIRGTGRRGLSSLGSSDTLIRPLLRHNKADIYSYAKDNSLAWHEDSTNSDKKILRNKLRHDIVPRMTTEQTNYVLQLAADTARINAVIDKELSALMRRGLHKGQPVVSRKWFAQLPHDIATEVVYLLLRQTKAKDINKKTVERVVVAIKTMPQGKTIQIPGVDINLTKRSARFIQRSQTDKKQV